MTAPAEQPIEMTAETTIETETLIADAVDLDRLLRLLERAVKALELIGRELQTLRRHIK